MSQQPSAFRYGLVQFQEVLVNNNDSYQKADKLLDFIKNNLSRVQTCMNFSELVSEARQSREMYIKLYVIFIYMLRDPIFFESICASLNEYAKEKIKLKMDELKNYILGLHAPIGNSKESWKYHLGVYIHSIQHYCLCL